MELKIFIARYLSVVVYDLLFSNGSENIFKMNLLVIFCFSETLDMIGFCHSNVQSHFEAQIPFPIFIWKLSQVQNLRVLVDFKSRLSCFLEYFLLQNMIDLKYIITDKGKRGHGGSGGNKTLSLPLLFVMTSCMQLYTYWWFHTCRECPKTRACEWNCSMDQQAILLQYGRGKSVHFLWAWWEPLKTKQLCYLRRDGAQEQRPESSLPHQSAGPQGPEGRG